MRIVMSLAMLLVWLGVTAVTWRGLLDIWGNR